MAVEKVSPEAIKKALETLGLAEVETSDDNSTSQSKEEIEKAQKIETLKNQAKELGFDVIEKADGGATSPATISTGENGAANGGTLTPQKNTVVEDLIKGLEEKVLATATLAQAKAQENDELKKSIEQVIDFNRKLGEKLNMIEKQPLDRKSVGSATYIDRDFNKGGDSTPSNGEKVLSISRNKSELVDALFNAATKNTDKIDSEFAKAVENIEISNSLGSNPGFVNRIAQRAQNELKIKIVK